MAEGTGAQRGDQLSRTGKVPSGKAEGVGAEPAELLSECYQAPEGGKWFPAVGKGGAKMEGGAGEGSRTVGPSQTSCRGPVGGLSFQNPPLLWDSPRDQGKA